MKPHMPLVTIGIPTYNRAEMLRRSIESALHQDYSMIEVIISDNASTDGTQGVCQEFRKKDDRVNCIVQSSNIGASANFAEVLKRAAGEFFMWLGDDDWIDASYVSHCVSLLRAEPDVALASGAAKYYKYGLKSHDGKLFDLLDKAWAIRVAHYYLMVSDNGMFYGVTHTAQLQKIIVPNVMGGDWHLVANIVSTGKIKMNSEVSVHRELGGATASYRQISKSLGLPVVQAIFPMTTIAFGALINVIFYGSMFKKKNIAIRLILGGCVFFLIIMKPTFSYLVRTKRSLMREMSFVFDAARKK